MARKRYTPEQIIRLLRQAEVLSSQGRNVLEISREIGVTEATFQNLKDILEEWRIEEVTSIR